MAIRNMYSALGVEQYYEQYGGEYANPHEEIISKLVANAISRGLIGNRVLDLCCGSGEISSMLAGYDVVGADPYTYESYYNRIGHYPMNLSFMDIAKGKLQERFDTIICSFALHLCPQSLLPQVLWQLSLVCDSLIIITPNKKPDCELMGWLLVDEISLERVKMKTYWRTNK